MDQELLKRIPRLYHFTDRRNLAVIQELGGLYPLAELQRMSVKIPAPGGNEWSHDADRMRGLDEYVHLCFDTSHPMEFRAREEGRIENSIFLVVHPGVLLWEDVLFTSDVSNKSGVVPHPIDVGLGMIDFEVLYKWTDWRDPEIQQRLQQARKCEVLARRMIPLEMIANLPHG